MFGENKFREKKIKDITKGNVDWEKVRYDVPRNFGAVLESRLSLVEKYAKEKNLSEKEYTALREIEIINARNAYLYQRNQENIKSNDILAKNELVYNNQEIKALNSQYNKRASVVGKYINDFNNYATKQNTNKR